MTCLQADCHAAGSGCERCLVRRRKRQHGLLDVVLLLKLAFHPPQPHGQAVLDVVTGHIDRRNEVEPTWANVFQVQVGDAVNVRPFYQVAEHLLPNFGANDLSNQKAAIAIDQEDRDDR